MSFTESVLERTKHLEKLLTNLGGTGRGLHKRANSIESVLDGALLRRLHYVATIRNKVVHEHDYTFDGNPQDFLRSCERMIAQLSALVAARTPAGEAFSEETPPGLAAGSSDRAKRERLAGGPSPANIVRVTAVLCTVACLAGLPYTCTRSVERPSHLFGGYETVTDWSGVIFWGTVWTTAVCLLANGMTKRR